MWSKRIKKVLAQIVVISLVIPNLKVNAESYSIEKQVSTITNIETVDEDLIGEEYKIKKVEIPSREVNKYYLAEKIEYKLKMEALSNMTTLETKTDLNYEVALAHEDGTFTYVSSVDSIEEAIDKVEILEENFEKDLEGTVSKLTNSTSSTSTSRNSTLAAVINSSGQVVYSTNSMARILKHINGEPYYYADKTIKLYSDSALTKATTYINHMYVDDAPILEDAGTSAKILVSGEEAWINKDSSKSEYDMIVVPLNQVVNPSYYMAKNGELKHFISYDLRGTTGYTITIGKAPSYLVEGVKYLSYDGIYFYSGQDIQSGLNTLMTDYKSGVTTNAVNSSNPFYLYYQYLSFRSKTVYTSTELDEFIVNNTSSTSKLRGLGTALKNAEETYGVNAVLSLGVAINESAWGMSSIAQSKNNLFGLNAVDSNAGQAADTYSTPAESVIEFAKNYISRGYADPADSRYYGGFLGNKNSGANVQYASDPFWGEKASQHYFTVDKYLSKSISNLKDNDNYQLGMATTNNKVLKSDGTLLYNITDDKNQYAAYVNTPFIISKTTKVTVAGNNSYEINPERTTPVNAGGTANKFSGNYDWNTKGYVSESGIKFLNTVNNSNEDELTGVDLIYANAYNATVKALDVKTQKSINEARAAIDELKKVLPKHNAIPTWSSMVDTVQHPIFVQIVDTILELQGKVSRSEKITQAEINTLRTLQLNDMEDNTDNIPTEYLNGAKYGWSEMTDNLQQVLLNEIVDAVIKAEETKTQAAVDAAQVLIDDVSTSVSIDMVQWAKHMETRLHNI